MAKLPSPSSPSHWETGEAPRASAAADLAALDHGGDRGWGEKELGGRGVRFPGSPRAGAALRGGATGAGGGGSGGAWRRR